MKGMDLFSKAPPGLPWLLVGAGIFFVDALYMQRDGHQQFADIGFVISVGTVCFAAVFCDWGFGRRH